MAKEEVFPINIWINEERYEKLQKAGLSDMAEEVFAGLKRLQVPANEEQKDAILNKFPMAKYDSATTRSIELLPREVKDRIFDLVVEKRSLDIINTFLKS
ncbi:unnamed protein product [marine sediment metagenome]|uniref:Uncharacterized protein n=1 Tax=marine sediment metagenome TaxID=412755 RepID=X1AKU1_9ZZZZ